MPINFSRCGFTGERNKSNVMNETNFFNELIKSWREMTSWSWHTSGVHIGHLAGPDSIVHSWWCNWSACGILSGLRQRTINPAAAVAAAAAIADEAKEPRVSPWVA